jgi:hypothetical protein
MAEAVYERDFQLWSYGVGMKQLLLRSNRTSELSTRVDIAFQAVGWLELPTVLHGVTIDVDVAQDMKSVSERGVSIGRRHLYSLSGLDYRGFVVAFVLRIAEDEGGYDEPSSVIVTVPRHRDVPPRS